MGKTLYLHVGTHKTATTALQEFCRDNSHRLRPGFLYPSTGRAEGGGHHYIFNCIRQPHHDEFSPQMTFDQYLKQLETETGNSENILMSSEMLSGQIDIDSLARLKDQVDHVVIIIYLRPQHSYLVSIYGERVRSLAWIKTLPETIADINLDYYRICEKWSHAFGRDNIIVRPFEKCQFVGGTIFSDLLAIFDLPLTDQYTMPRKPRNLSSPRDVIEFKRAMNFLPLPLPVLREVRDHLIIYSKKQMKPPRSSRLIRRIKKHLPGCPGNIGNGAISNAQLSKQWLSYAQKLEIMDACSASNARVAREFLGRQDGRLFYEGLPQSTGQEPAYPGLSIGKIRDMAGYLKKHDRQLFNEIAHAVTQALQSGTPETESLRDLSVGFGCRRRS